MNNDKDFNIEKRIKEDNRKDPAIIYSYEDKFARRGDKYGTTNNKLYVKEDDDSSDDKADLSDDKADSSESKSTILSLILDILLDLIDI